MDRFGAQDESGDAPADGHGDEPASRSSRPEKTTRFLGAILADEYQILAVIGEGAMGTVFRARQIKIDREVAVKVMHRRLAGDDLAVKRFENEAKIISQLRHPNTLRLYDCSRTSDGDIFIVTELLKGTPLARVIVERGRLAFDRSVRVIDGICRSLSEAHAMGIVHRDLKPENVFLDRVGSEDIVKVLDFGLAKINEAGDHLTLPGRINGTPLYMSPEQIAGEELDGRTDIYALGIMLYEMLAGVPPFVADSVPALLGKQIQEAPIPLGKKYPHLHVTPEIDRLILGMLQKRREDRPGSVDEVRLKLFRLTGLTAAPEALVTRTDLKLGSAVPAAHIDEARGDTTVKKPMPHTGEQRELAFHAPISFEPGTNTSRGTPTSNAHGRSEPRRSPAFVRRRLAPLGALALAALLLWRMAGERPPSAPREAAAITRERAVPQPLDSSASGKSPGNTEPGAMTEAPAQTRGAPAIDPGMATPPKAGGDKAITMAPPALAERSSSARAGKTERPRRTRAPKSAPRSTASRSGASEPRTPRAASGASSKAAATAEAPLRSQAERTRPKTDESGGAEGEKRDFKIGDGPLDVPIQ